MTTGTLIIIGGVLLLAFGLFFIIVRRMLRMAFKLALFAAMVFALLAGALFYWWNAGSSPSSSPTRPTQGRPTPAARPTRGR